LKNASRNRETSKAYLAKIPKTSPSSSKVSLFPSEEESPGKKEIAGRSLIKPVRFFSA
jgi:hypothetical protein